MNKSFFLLFIVFFNGCNKLKEADILISNVNIIDVETGKIVKNQDVFILADTIKQIEDHSQHNRTIVPQQIDATGQFLIPGLWDMHTHTLVDYRYQHCIPIQVAYGITGFRDMGGSIKLRDSIQQMEWFQGLPVPRMKVAGYIIGGDPGRDGAPTATIEEARQYVEILATAGADHIKTYYYLHPEVYLAVVEQAQKLGLTVQGHVPNAFGMEGASRLGQKSIEHMSAVPYWCTSDHESISKTMMATWHGQQKEPDANTLLDFAMENIDSKAIAQMAQTLMNNNTYLCPTMSTYEYLTHIRSPEYQENEYLDFLNPIEKYYFTDDTQWSQNVYMKDSTRGIRHLTTRKKILKQLHGNGVKLIAGTDAGVAFHGIHLHKELEIYVESGLSPLEALQTATLNPAIFLNIQHKSGTIKTGHWADLVILDENPLEEISNTRSIAGVIAQGRYVSRAQIEHVKDSMRSLFNRPGIIDTVKSFAEKSGLDSALILAKSLKRSNPQEYVFDGLQFLVYAFEIWDDEHQEEVCKLLKTEIEINPHQQWFPLLQLGYLYRSQNKIDSAQMVYQNLLDYFGPSELRAYSYLRRILQPDYGKQIRQPVPLEIKNNLTGHFYNDQKHSFGLSFYKEQLILNNQGQFDTLDYVGNYVFRSIKDYHQRIVMEKPDKQEFTYIDFNDVIKYSKTMNQ